MNQPNILRVLNDTLIIDKVSKRKVPNLRLDVQGKRIQNQSLEGFHDPEETIILVSRFPRMERILSTGGI